ncbi:MAG TPA: hypothetical protein VLM83_04385, partial [Anaerolineales bacterium]|nr:hypothetical protein [Anaerolineales bacterium]
QTVSRKTMVLGAVMYSRHDLELAQAKGVVYDIKVVGAVLLDSSITPELALATISRIKIYGVLRASQAVKDALAERINQF